MIVLVLDEAVEEINLRLKVDYDELNNKTFQIFSETRNQKCLQLILANSLTDKYYLFFTILTLALMIYFLFEFLIE